MEFKDIATVSGKPGLYKVLKPSRSGVILESLDEKKGKLVVGAAQRVSLLSEISIYTLTEEGASPLQDIMIKIEKEFKGDTGLEGADKEEYQAFMKHILPEFDEDRVYASDVKKLINWYHIVRSECPEVLEEPEATEESESKEEKE
ncbi:DUF5606 family protein [Cyclobacterium amurskyense]|jgi:hypothetical protein|uniref:Uncharacterized protein n=1 Tax=Cyclobacterium amurskyense TaxID=320787 RepID=A0A0H4P9L4_9BACT|nr:DUF5606 domain-containing protein [Cyclobacterium amurskyense]AKP51171.1 hypothetical protein CA2015_1738 [Cyclobacterium amurskyense]|tara:strand:- start:304 stop:741 length:438 start_codon:yes stop_codon:yes gene_type:complete